MQRRRRVRLTPARALIAQGLGILGMFHLTCAGWLIFRAESFQQIVAFAGALTGSAAPSSSESLRTLGLPLLLYAAPLLVLHAAEAASGEEAMVLRWRPIWRYSVVAALGYLIVLFGDFQGSEFIYFQF
jgi:hypothetical protein